jgi:hypothetical protein
MNFFLPSFFDYLQNQPSLGILQHHFDYADAETASISTMILTVLLLLSTVEGVVIFCTTLYSWCLFPLHSSESLGFQERQRRREQRRQRRQRRFGTNGDNAGDYHLFWWLDIVYDDFDYTDDDSDSEDGYRDEFDDNYENDDVFQKCDSRRLSRRDRIQMSLQEKTFSETHYDACCAICLVDFAPDDKVVSGTQTCCKNCFHRDCLEHWLQLQKSCPCCRTNILLKSKELFSRHENPKIRNPLTASSFEESNRPEDLPQLTHAADAIPTVPGWRAESELAAADAWDQFWFLIF